MQRKLLESGNIFKRSDGRWNGVVWYSDEQSSKKRKSFCGTSKQEVKDKITAYLADFDRQLTASDESKAKFEESMGKWLRVFKFPSVERGTYDRLECTAKYQIYPILGGKVVGDITSADIKALLNHWMNEGYAYTTVKKVYNILTDYFRYLTQQEYIPKNPMAAAPMMRFTIADPSWHFSKEQHEVARWHILSFPQGDGEGATARRTGILLYGMNNYKI